MPKVTVNIVPSGAIKNNGSTSAAGHMWITLEDENGNKTDFGFQPDNSAAVTPNAGVVKDDSDRYFGHDKLSGVLPDWQSPKSDCRELNTVLAAAELFPLRVLYSSHTRQTIRHKNVANQRVQESDPVDGHGPLGVKVLEASVFLCPMAARKATA